LFAQLLLFKLLGPHRVKDFPETFNNELRVVKHVSFLGFSFLVNLVNELLHDTEESLVEGTWLVFSFLLEGLLEDVVSLFVITVRYLDVSFKRNIVFVRRLDRFVRTLEPLRVGPLIPEFKQLCPPVVLHRIKVGVNSHVRLY
jgi:hypothetical protein